MSEQRHKVAKSSDIKTNALFAIQVEKQKLLLSRVAGEVHAVIDRCPHFGMSMAKGKAVGNVVSCPWHGSSFDLVSGENLDWVTGVLGKKVPDWTCKLISMGKKPAPLTTVVTEEKDGDVFVLLP